MVRDNVINELLHGDQPLTMKKIPWSLFSKEEKRKFILREVDQCRTREGGLHAINKARYEFRYAIPDDEWEVILNEKIVEDKHELVKAVKENLESLQEYFPNEKLRELLNQKENVGSIKIVEA